MRSTSTFNIGFSLLVLFLPIYAFSQDCGVAKVPKEFLGRWVAGTSCTATLSIVVMPNKVSLFNGKDQATFGDLCMSYSYAYGNSGQGITVGLVPEFNSGYPFVVVFNTNERRGVTTIDSLADGLKTRFPVEDIQFRKCPNILNMDSLTASSGPSQSKSLTTTGYIDLIENTAAGCSIRIIVGEKVYIGIVPFSRLSLLTKRRVSSYEEVLAALDGRQVRVTLSGIGSSCGDNVSCNFTGVSQLYLLAEGPSDQINQRLNKRTTASETIIDLSTDILFDFNKSTINPKAIPSLIQLARLLRQSKSASVQLNGFTDSIGSDEYNVGLSQRRAAAVKEWLVAKGGIDAGRLTTNGFGKDQPVAPNTLPNGSDSPSGRRKNRRVEIRIPR